MLDAKTLAWAEALDPALIAKTASQRHVQSVIEDLVSVVCRQHAEIERLTKERDALRAELDALREQKPVAYTTGLTFRERQSEVVVKLTRKAQPEYGFTHALYVGPQPPAREVKRLTDEQINEIEDGFSNEFGLEAKYSADFARAIETACAVAWGVKLEGGE